MQDLIREYEQSAQAIYGRIEHLQELLANAQPSGKYEIEDRIRKLRAMHLELHRDIEDMRGRAPHV